MEISKMLICIFAKRKNSAYLLFAIYPAIIIMNSGNQAVMDNAKSR